MVEADLSFLDEDEMLQAAMNDVMLELIDEVTLGLCFEVHRATKRGTIFLSDTDPQSCKDHEVVDRPGVDVFGQVPTKKQFECVCPNCQRHLAASRFAPHLEKCMGMGRNSSRIASRRIANNSTKRESGDESGDDDNDNDWTYVETTKRAKRPLKKEKGVNSPRRNKSQMGKVKNGDSSNDNVGTPESGSLNYETMTIEERKSLLLNTCGVISEHTKKLCTRSVRCPQHTDEQRSKVRQNLLRQGSTLEAEDVHVDIDSIDDAENQSLRETLQWEASSNSSPADSTSTNNSTGSRKRSQKSSSKSGGNKKKKTGKSSSSANNGSNTSSSASTNLYDFS